MNSKISVQDLDPNDSIFYVEEYEISKDSNEMDLENYDDIARLVIPIESSEEDDGVGVENYDDMPDLIPIESSEEDDGVGVDNSETLKSEKNYKIKLENGNWVTCRDYQRDAIESFVENESNKMSNVTIKTKSGGKFYFEGSSMKYRYYGYAFDLNLASKRVQNQEGSCHIFIMTREDGTTALMKAE